MAILIILEFVFPLSLISTPRQEHHRELLTLRITLLHPEQKGGPHQEITRVSEQWSNPMI